MSEISSLAADPQLLFAGATILQIALAIIVFCVGACLCYAACRRLKGRAMEVDGVMVAGASAALIFMITGEIFGMRAAVADAIADQTVSVVLPILAVVGMAFSWWLLNGIVAIDQASGDSGDGSNPRS